jgi:hypothetical protein
MEVSGHVHSPTKKALAPNGYEAGWESEPVWALSSKEKSLASAGNRTLAIQPAAHFYTD